MCSASLLALLPGLPWPWSGMLVAGVPLVVGGVLTWLLVALLTTHDDRRRLLALVRQRVGRWFSWLT
jgi:hypothetical protein